MVRSISLFAVVGLVACSGCRAPLPKVEATGDIKPALLIGPEANAEAPPPVELPKKEAAVACLRTAQQYETEGRHPDKAIELYEKARSQDHSQAKAVSRRLAVLYDKVGDFSKSTMEYEQLIKANPKDADLMNDYGYSFYTRGDWATAESWFEKATRADGNHKKAWTNLGMARGTQGKWNESFEAFGHAVRPADAHCNLAFLMAARGQMEDAKAQYKQALSLDPGLRVAQAALAMIENPQAFAAQAAQASKKPTQYDAVEAAGKVPSFAELEARLVRDGALKPASLPTITLDTPPGK